ncbi:hypothetical protein MPRM_29490 [Mycobacterium parmense]|uniref:Uncharacterized protein n=1 Tax=Mycobacterium parmense TaxID=185642 RepID=A0A7I7YUX5_9MYCO|nr:hypothetical protein MPRM_29490 [Mycobacterium parmense]
MALPSKVIAPTPHSLACIGHRDPPRPAPPRLRSPAPPWRPAAPGSAALAIATNLRWRPAAPGSAALAIATNLRWRPAAPGSAALAIATKLRLCLAPPTC